MQRRRVRSAAWLVPATAALALGLLAPAPADAQAPVPAGAEFQINTYTTNAQLYPSVAADADGDFVVVWASIGSPGTDTIDRSIQGQRYASNGSPQGAQFQVNTYTTGSQYFPSVAADADGDFVVVWVGPRIQGQRYASDGSTQGAQFQVNTYTTSFQDFPSVAADADGDFVVVWESNGSSGTDTSLLSIQGQRYASNGSTQGAQLQVNTYTTDSQISASVATDTEGDFVVVWDSDGSSGTDSSLYSIQGQRYGSTGLPLGAQFQVNTFAPSNQYNASVDTDADGDFVVVWNSNLSSGTDTSFPSIQSQRYASNGSTQGAQFQVNTYTTNYQWRASVAVDANGDFVVVWQSLGSSGTDTSAGSIQGQRYASSGSTQGAQFQVNTYTTSIQQNLSVAADADGDFVVVWESNGSSGTDSSSSSIQGQRYSVPAPPGPPPVPAMSTATRFALAAVLLLLGAAYALRRRS
jgi:hypothetical protein